MGVRERGKWGFGGLSWISQQKITFLKLKRNWQHPRNSLRVAGAVEDHAHQGISNGWAQKFVSDFSIFFKHVFIFKRISSYKITFQMVAIHIITNIVTINKYRQTFFLRFWPLQLLLLSLDPMQNQKGNHLWHSVLFPACKTCCNDMRCMISCNQIRVSILMQFDMVCKYKIVLSKIWMRSISFAFSQHCNTEKLSWDIQLLL